MKPRLEGLKPSSGLHNIDYKLIFKDSMARMSIVEVLNVELKCLE